MAEKITLLLVLGAQYDSNNSNDSSDSKMLVALSYTAKNTVISPNFLV